MSWSVLWLRKSPGDMLGKLDSKPFSKPQTLVALLAWFTAQSRDDQARLVHEYLESRAYPSRPTGQGGSRVCPS
jgi:hypothetical protein